MSCDFKLDGFFFSGINANLLLFQTQNRSVFRLEFEVVVIDSPVDVVEGTHFFKLGNTEFHIVDLADNRRTGINIKNDHFVDFVSFQFQQTHENLLFDKLRLFYNDFELVFNPSM